MKEIEKIARNALKAAEAAGPQLPDDLEKLLIRPQQDFKILLPGKSTPHLAHSDRIHSARRTEPSTRKRATCFLLFFSSHPFCD